MKGQIYNTHIGSCLLYSVPQICLNIWWMNYIVPNVINLPPECLIVFARDVVPVSDIALCTVWAALAIGGTILQVC